MSPREQLKTTSIEALEAELKVEQEALKRSESALTRMIGSSERDQVKVSLRICEAKIRDLKRQIARVAK